MLEILLIIILLPIAIPIAFYLFVGALGAAIIIPLTILNSVLEAITDGINFITGTKKEPKK